MKLFPFELQQELYIFFATLHLLIPSLHFKRIIEPKKLRKPLVIEIQKWV